ncbi:MAG: hypothetical protein IPK19_09555 [Chloroflexi bacterium]|nr:hypothetical protein [Chloroflexota bacterium]
MTTKTCPKCGQGMTLDVQQGMFRCPSGHKIPETLDEASERIRARGQRPVIARTFKGQLHPRAQSLFESAHDYLHNGNLEAALDAFQDALDVQPDFTDAYLWIARIATDPARKRENLEQALAQDPGNLDALRDLMVLDGRMTADEAERSKTTGGPILRRAERVKAETRTLKCPVCGGALTIDETNSRVVCKFCGHTAPLDAVRAEDGGAQLLGAAMLKQRARGEKWIVGERVQHCQQCGAERTIAQGRLSGTCPFCGSQAVILSDAVGALEEPDGILPFEVDEEIAKASIRERLRAVDERMYAMMGDNKVAQARLEGLYLPFWIFDAVIEVSQTITDRRTPHSRDQVRRVVPYENRRFQDGLLGISVPAVKTPPAALLLAMDEYELGRAKAYDPRMLAKFPAQIYDIDFDEASLTARSTASSEMRKRYQAQVSPNVDISVYALVQQMTFQLLLLPVWVGVLVERDGDVRTALVNGQTGQAVLGAAQKKVR